MTEFSDSYVMRVLFAPPKTRRDARRWRWLASSPLDPYRPDLHYMRGPGPAWRQKNQP